MFRTFSLFVLLVVVTVGCKRNDYGHSHTAQEPAKAVHVSSEEGKEWNVFGVKITGKILSEDTDGDYTVILTETPPNGGPPLHVHTNEDELFYVLKGNYTFYSGDKVMNAKEGDFIRLLKGIPHRFTNTDSITGITMNTITPGGFEHFFDDIAAHSQNGRPSPKVVDSIAGVYGITFLKE